MRRLLGVLAFLAPLPLAAQSLTFAEPWYGPVPGARHAPIVHVSVGQLNYADGVHHWCVACEPIPLAALSFGRDSAALSESPRLVWELKTAANARITANAFACKKPGDTVVRVRWLDAAGAALASDSTVIRCHP
jgi:hypothetical protein